MHPVRTSSLALLTALAAMPVAHAQDAVAPAERVSVTAGYSLSEPTGSATVGGARAEADGDGAATASVTYHVTDNIGIEAWGAVDKLGHRVRSGGGKAGSVDAQPVALSGQYRFGQSGDTVRPFVGLGYQQTNYDNEAAQAGGAFAGQRLGVETSKGPMASAGVDVNFSPRWFGRADVRYLHGDSKVMLDGADAGDASLDPVMAGISVGARF